MEIQKQFIGMIGLGYWGKNILRNLHDLGVLHTFTTSLDEMLKNPDIKAVAISTPAATHYEIVKQSLLAGKDVFVEKCQG
jgi:UDP-2-acetamido-3-amino-2,3-dideoxy-glucuronate N-acetyltransferase